MALNAYLTLKGQKQGLIKGSVTQKGRENQIAVYGISHDIVSPRDSASGLPTGKRMHKPFMISKELDKSTPLLYQALVTNENISEFTLKFYSPSVNAVGGGGAEVQSFTVKLTNASIASIHEEMQLNKIEPGIKLPLLEEIAFTYQKIEWTWVDGGITSQDTWEARIV